MKFTKERREIRQKRDELHKEREELEKLIRQNRRAILKLEEEECSHPAIKHGCIMGMGFSDCPDCGYSQP